MRRVPMFLFFLKKMRNTNETGGKSVHQLDISIDFSLKDGEAKKERVLAILKFMKKLSDFEKRSAKRNLLVGLKKG